MKNTFLVITMSICFVMNSCKGKTTATDTSSHQISHPANNNIEEQKLNDDKSIILKSKAEGIFFLVRKKIDGQFMTDQYYSEQLKVVYGDCSVDLPKTNGQIKISVFPKTLNHGDWDNDGEVDWEFAYRLNEDGVDYVINYVVITGCQMSIIENIFYEDEDTFLEEYEDEVSHIKNIRNAKDYYIRNFAFQIDKNTSVNDILKSHLKESFTKFVESNNYLE